MSYVEALDKVEKRIEKYWSTEEINIDIANQLIDDCAGLVLDVKEYRELIKEQAKIIQSHIMFQDIVKHEIGKEKFHKYLELWSNKVSKEWS